MKKMMKISEKKSGMKLMTNVTRQQNLQLQISINGLMLLKQLLLNSLDQYTEENPVNETLVKKYYHDVLKEASRRLVLDDNIRLDGRKPDEISQIDM